LGVIRGDAAGTTTYLYEAQTHLPALTNAGERLDRKHTRLKRELTGWTATTQPAKFKGYEVLAGFVKDATSPWGKDWVGIADTPGHALIVKYQKSHLKESNTLAHELGHLFVSITGVRSCNVAFLR
jgi:hypothetical protein